MIISTLAFSQITVEATGANGWQQNGTTWNYLVDGTKETGWNLISGKWYYLNPNGDMAMGWKQLGTKWYYLNANGDMAVNTTTIDGYKVDINGAWISWIKSNGKWYNNDGTLATGWIQYSGKWYLLNPNGAIVTGWKKLGTTWYYLKPNGEMVIGFLGTKNKMYYFNDNGDMVIGWKHFKDPYITRLTWFYFNSSGESVTGWLKSNDKWYFLESNGKMSIGWIYDGAKWYFLNDDGDMLVNKTTPDRYKVGADGAWDGETNTKPVYNGYDITKKLADLGFAGGYEYTWTAGNANQYISYGIPSFSNMPIYQSDTDMYLNYTVNNTEMDKVKTILSWILPTRANDLYTMLSNPTKRTETFELDGRTVSLTVDEKIIQMKFSPTFVK